MVDLAIHVVNEKLAFVLVLVCLACPKVVIGAKNGANFWTCKLDFGTIHFHPLIRKIL